MFSFRLENEQSQIGERRDALFFFLYFDAHILHNGCIILERNFYPLRPSLTLSTYSFPLWEKKSKKGKITYTYSGMSECSFWLSVLINLCNQISFTSFSSFLLILLFEQQQMIMMMGGKNTNTHTQDLMNTINRCDHRWNVKSARRDRAMSSIRVTKNCR